MSSTVPSTVPHPKDKPIPAKHKAILLPSNEIVDCPYIHDRAMVGEHLYIYQGTSEGIAYYLLSDQLSDQK